MEQLAKFITDERTGLEYELCGDYYIIAGEDEPEREPIGIWGQRHLNYIQKHCIPFYYKMLGEHTLYDYLCQINQDVEDMYILLVKQMAEREGVTEKLKAENQMEWVGKKNNIRQRATEAIVSCKGKTRKIFIVSALRKKLLRYATEHKINSGIIFVTKSGKPIDRSNIWREMKSLCEQAGVSPGKVFPHNLRHLFARTFYGIEKDIAKLADILGHSNINTTRIYIITTGAEHQRRMENMRLII